jgi:hypothetical protein
MVHVVSLLPIDFLMIDKNTVYALLMGGPTYNLKLKENYVRHYLLPPSERYVTSLQGMCAG